MRPAPSSHPRQRGFTLIELIVASVVAAIVLATIGASISQVARARASAKVRLSSSLRANTALERVRRELQQAVRSDALVDSRVVIESDKTDSPVGELDRDSILVYSTKLSPVRDQQYSGDGFEHEVQCRVEEDEAGSALWIRSDGVPDENELGGGQAVPVMDGVIGLNVEAFDGSAWYDEWDSDVFGMPWALRITLSTGGAPDGEDLYSAGHDLLSLRTIVPIDRVVPPYEEPPPAETPTGDGAGLSGETAADAAGAGVLPGGDAAGGGGAVSGGGSRGPGDDRGGSMGRGGGDVGGRGGMGGRGGGAGGSRGGGPGGGGRGGPGGSGRPGFGAGPPGGGGSGARGPG